jgi:hypothetical protein
LPQTGGYPAGGSFPQNGAGYPAGGMPGAMSMNGGGAAKAPTPSAKSLMDGTFSDLGLGGEKKAPSFGQSAPGSQLAASGPPKDMFSNCDPFKVAA